MPFYRLPPDIRIREVITPLSEVYDWSQKMLGIPDLWALSAGEGVRVCILDTGCDVDHPDLAGAILDARDFTGSRFGFRDRVDHGTWCAGCIGARANDQGVRGTAFKSQLLIGKVLGDQGAGTDQTILGGLEWGLNKGADFFSLSLGGGEMGEQLHQEIVKAAAAGKFVFCAAGNDGAAINFPAAYIETIAVGASDQNGNLTQFTSRVPINGRGLDIVAPGVEMLSTIPGGRYGTMTGTSMATPIAAAIGALAVAKHRKAGQTDLANVQQMREHLIKTSTDKGAYRLINPKGLLSEEPPPVPGPPVTPVPGRTPLLQVGNIKVYMPAAATDAIGIDLGGAAIHSIHPALIQMLAQLTTL